MRYAVYINWTRKRACWHREGCGFIKMNGGTAERASQEWVECDTIAQVHQTLRAKTQGFDPSEIRACSACKPDKAP
jgi:hypothetical protein